MPVFKIGPWLNGFQLLRYFWISSSVGTHFQVRGFQSEPSACADSVLGVGGGLLSSAHPLSGVNPPRLQWQAHKNIIIRHSTVYREFGSRRPAHRAIFLHGSICPSFWLSGWMWVIEDFGFG
jgi:hypothetical protein